MHETTDRDTVPRTAVDQNNLADTNITQIEKNSKSFFTCPSSTPLNVRDFMVS